MKDRTGLAMAAIILVAVLCAGGRCTAPRLLAQLSAATARALGRARWHNGPRACIALP